ncbi:hypothetical protein RSAG8_10704, partial [Rhizoctonia solani AG-8 WAC10335]
MNHAEDSVLATIFAQCKPGTLKFLTISHYDGNPIFLDVASGRPEYANRKCEVLTMGNLDPALASVTVLRVKGIYPIWTSKAYHGLVELRLIHSASLLYHSNISISENHLRGILAASPALRILEFSVEIVEMLPDDASSVPVPLNLLALINIAEMSLAQIGIFWRLLAPGSKPLRLAIADNGQIVLCTLKCNGTLCKIPQPVKFPPSARLMPPSQNTRLG